jgi:hypothetical protein
MFGSIRRNKKKVRKAYYRLRSDQQYRGHTMAVKVTVSRAETGMGGSGKIGYGARACVSRTKATFRAGAAGVVHKCGNLGEGATPTAAIKKALHALARKLR